MKLNKKEKGFVLNLSKEELEDLLKDGRMEDQWWDGFDYDDLEDQYKRCLS